MVKRHSPLPVSAGRSGITVSIPAVDLPSHASLWLLDCEDGQLSPKTIHARRQLLGKLRWFLERSGHQDCGTEELRGFIRYVSTAHEDAGGRWGNDGAYRSTRKASRGTIETYHRILTAFFNYLIREGVLDANPMAPIRKPPAAADQIQPFSRSRGAAVPAGWRRGVHLP